MQEEIIGDCRLICGVNLLPCPFCGGVAIIVYKDDDTEYQWQARCNNADCYGWHDTYEKTEKDASNAWNTRPTR